MVKTCAVRRDPRLTFMFLPRVRPYVLARVATFT